MSTRIDDPKNFFEGLGNLHDARIEELRWSPEEREIAFAVDDLHSNFAGLPEYPGLRPQVLILEGVVEFVASVCLSEPNLNVHDFEVSTEPTSGLSVSVTFWPDGRIKVLCSGLRME